MARVCCVCRLPAPVGQKLKRCTRCRGLVRYCGVECQRVDWPVHQAVCGPTAPQAPPTLPPAAAAAAPRRPPPLVLSAELILGIREAREFVADSLRGARPWVVDLKDGKGLGALESHAKMQLLIEVLKTRHAYAFEEVAVNVGVGGGGGSVTGRFHLFEPQRDGVSSSGVNLLALAFGLGCSGPVVVEIVTAAR